VLKFVFAWLLFVNLAAFLVYWWDKRRAVKGGRRVSERELLLWALAGGSLGSWIAMRRFHHKTRKIGFRLSFWGIVLLQVALLLWLLWRS